MIDNTLPLEHVRRFVRRHAGALVLEARTALLAAATTQIDEYYTPTLVAEAIADLVCPPAGFLSGSHILGTEHGKDAVGPGGGRNRGRLIWDDGAKKSWNGSQVRFAA